MRARWLIALALVLVGLVWIAQGMGFVGGTGFMNGSLFWAGVGVLLVICGGVVAWTAFRARSQV